MLYKRNLVLPLNKQKLYMKGDFTITILFLVLVSVFLQPINQKNPKKLQLFEKQEKLNLPQNEVLPDSPEAIPLQMELEGDTIHSLEHFTKLIAGSDCVKFI